MNQPQKYCLATLNAIGKVVDEEVKNRVRELEQLSSDSLDRDYYSNAAEYKASAREMEVFRYRLSSAITAVFIEALQTQENLRAAPVVSAVESATPVPEVELPAIPAKNRTLAVVPTPER